MAVADPAIVHDASPREQKRRLRNGLISLVLLVALVAAGLLLAVPGLHGVASRRLGWNARGGWVVGCDGGPVNNRCRLGRPDVSSEIDMDGPVGSSCLPRVLLRSRLAATGACAA